MTKDTEFARQALAEGLARLAQILRLKVGDSESLTGMRAALGKCGAHFKTAEALLKQVNEIKDPVNRARLALGAFDATWMGWNSLFARKADLESSGDRRSHLEAAKSALNDSESSEELHRTSLAFRDLLACETSKSTGQGSRRIRRTQPIWNWIHEAGEGSQRDPNKRGLARTRLKEAATSAARDRVKLVNCCVDALYELRCRRIHGDLLASTIGSPARMRSLCAVGIQLISLLVAAEARERYA